MLIDHARRLAERLAKGFGHAGHQGFDQRLDPRFLTLQMLGKLLMLLRGAVERHVIARRQIQLVERIVRHPWPAAPRGAAGARAGFTPALASRAIIFAIALIELAQIVKLLRFHAI